ncbi:MAG: TMEM175 family protein [Maricaulis sp.]|jgi:uncharacterized membrane protein|nr:TMEM175 family protein [Maricaulis sp.]MDG2045406.1 TMEM175 family protein [Maricaulis sp.]
MSEGRLRGIQAEDFFRWRGKEVSRTENLSDIVFAMALTLIVASSVPESFAALTELWREGLAIALCFTMLLMIWHIHYIYFRRYDLEDGTTILLNSVLIFLVMIFAYPLKFLASFLVNFFTGGFATNHAIAEVLTLDQAPWLSTLYSVGYACVFVVITLLYWHALKRADDVGLNEAERILTRAAVQANLTHVVFGVVIAGLSFVLPGNWGLMAGAFWGLLGIPLTIIGRRSRAAAKAALTD